MLNGLMMDDYQLSLTSLVERAERLTPTAPVVSRRGDGSMHRTTIGECAERARRLARGLADLGNRDGDRVATLLWNQTEHLELYYAVPLMGAVIHTLNPRLQRRRSELHRRRCRGPRDCRGRVLLHLLDSIDWDFEHVIVVSVRPMRRRDRSQYESLIASSEPMSWPAIDERRAAAMCYTSGTTGRPKGSDLFTSGARPALARVSPAECVRDQLARRDLAGGADVPRQRAGACRTRLLDGCRVGAARPSSRSSERAGLLAERARDIHGWGADGVDGDPARHSTQSLSDGILGRCGSVNLGGAAIPPSLIEGLDRHGLTIVQGGA